MALKNSYSLEEIRKLIEERRVIIPGHDPEHDHYKQEAVIPESRSIWGIDFSEPDPIVIDVHPGPDGVFRFSEEEIEKWEKEIRERLDRMGRGIWSPQE